MARALALKPFNIHLLPLRDCGTAGAVVLHPFNIHFTTTAGVRECGTAGLQDCRSSSFTPI